MSCLKLIQPLSIKCSLHVISTPKRMFSHDLCNEVIEFNECSIPSQTCPTKEDIPTQPRGLRKRIPPTMWGENLECCIDCPGKPYRHDLIHLKSVHWKDRKYQRTWYECPRLCISEKTCKYEKLSVPEPEVRARGVGNPDAQWNRNFSDCLKVEKFTAGCQEPCKLRKQCTRRIPACCYKRCTLYPSFSECCRPPSKPSRPIECLCLSTTSLCAVNEYLAARGLLVKNK